MAPYGYELILDIHDCDTSTFNRESIDNFFEKICMEIKMVKCERYWWDDVGIEQNEQQSSPHTKGTSAVQFILTSSIVIHTLDLLGSVYINIFSCKPYDENLAKQITEEWFKGKIRSEHFIERI